MPDKPLIHQKLVAILRDMDAIAKDSKNPQQGYNFRGIDAIYNALHPLFAKHGVFIVPTKSELVAREDRENRKGGTLISTMVRVTFDFVAEDGSSISATIDGEGMDGGDKGTYKAITGALKYVLIPMFLIPTEEKIDVEYDSPEVVSQQSPTERIEQSKSKDELRALYKTIKQSKTISDNEKASLLGQIEERVKQIERVGK